MTDKPNIIYILSDQHRGQAMRHMGDLNVRTPNLDKMANEGVSFSRAYANCPICTPSRGTLFSGRHAHSGPVSGFFDVYKATAPSIATELQKEGYQTAYFGKWHCGVVRDQVPEYFKSRKMDMATPVSRAPEYHRAGFQDWAAFEVINDPYNTYVYENRNTEPSILEGYQTDVLTDMAINYLKNYDKSDPLMMVLSVEPPHFPLKFPPEWEKTNPEDLEIRPNFAKRSNFFPFTPEVDEQTLRKILANYYSCIENLDMNIGRVLDTIDNILGMKENTLIVYISDHGDYVGSHGLDTTKVEHHEESVRIPAIFRWPGTIPALGKVDHLFSLVDLLSTTLDIIDVEVPEYNQGTSFALLLKGNNFSGPSEVLLEMVNNPRWNLRFLDWRGLVTKRFKYAFCETGREEVFDLVNDPFEMHNLVNEDEALCRKLRNRLLELMKKNKEPYFDVLINHGVKLNNSVSDISDKSAHKEGVLWKGGLKEKTGIIL